MTTRLLKLGYVQHSFDKMVFLKRDQSGQLLSIIIVYVDVDDFLGVYRKDYNISEVHDAFVWGALNFFKLNEPLTFKGKELTLKLNSRGRHILVITQKESIHGLDSGKIPKGAELTEPLTPEQGELRSVASCLQRLCGQSRPELSPSVSLNSLSSKSTLANLGSLYFALDFAEETSNYGLVLPDVPLNPDTTLVSYSGSPAKAPGCDAAPSLPRPWLRTRQWTGCYTPTSTSSHYTTLDSRESTDV